MRFSLSLLGLVIMLTPVTAVGPQVEQTTFGKLADGKTVVTAYTLVNKNGAKIKVIDYGAIVTEIHVPDKGGNLADVALGFDNMDGYLKGSPYFGANAGRCANRIANGKFTLDGKEYQVTVNNGAHTLHGGKDGFDKKMWRADAPTMGAGGPSITLSYVSKDKEEGYPGNLSVKLTYTLTNDNELKVEYNATTDKTTLCNLAHHSYFNLAGHNSGIILGHEVEIFAKAFTPADETLIPTGKIQPVAGTPFDFTKPTIIVSRMKEVGGKPIGYDLNYVLDGKAGGVPFLAARVTDQRYGRTLEVYTDQPGLQFYTGNFLDGTNTGKGGAVYQQYNGFCMEPQKFPDAVNKVGTEGWVAPILKPGEEYKQTTSYRFGVKK
ncbi:aldose epimerase family protein [Limnoglobus roseus]|uniref:Aldose 1-epimerase n=1 Tax=Limnoglobus roseus TaxID=2598579 RepID=A0A5C1AI91_9BACT|nr:aldose epimerase family protein [Limnoglobus roseus]QEL17887.1 galactose mutarotase [Limnoglobus roseus]